MYPASTAIRATFLTYLLVFHIDVWQWEASPIFAGEAGVGPISNDIKKYGISLDVDEIYPSCAWDLAEMWMRSSRIVDEIYSRVDKI